MRLLIWILNAPLLMRRAIALGVAATLLAATLGAGILAANALSTARRDVVEKREFLGQLQAVVDLARSAGQSSESLVTTDELLTGDSDALIQSALQARLSEIASQNSTTVVSVGVVTDQSEGDRNPIGLRANLSGDFEGIHDTILALEINRPFLFIREAKLRSTNVMAGATLAAPVELFAELVFYGERKGAPGEGAEP